MQDSFIPPHSRIWPALFTPFIILAFLGSFYCSFAFPVLSGKAHAATLHDKGFIDPLLGNASEAEVLPILTPKPAFDPLKPSTPLYGHEMLKIVYTYVNSPLDAAWKDLIDKLVKDGFDRETVTGYFEALGRNSYSPIYMGQKVAEIHGVRSQAKRPSIDRSMLYSSPKILRKQTIGECVRFLENNRHHFRNIENKYGVSRDIVLSVALIETGLGRNLGGESSLRVLGSMAATTTPAMLGRNGNKNQVVSIDKTALTKTLKEKSDWAYRELTAILRYAGQNDMNAAQIPSSMYGAVGVFQFMPSNLKKFAVDGNGDGITNIFDPIDAMYSIAKYLHEHGWQEGNSEASTEALYAYNRSSIYVNNVFAVAERIVGGKQGHVALDNNPLTEIPSVHAKNYSNLYSSG